MEIGREDDAAGREGLQGKLPSQALVGLGGVLDQDSARPRLEERVERQASPTLGQRDDDAIGPGRLDDATEILGVLHHADDGVSEMRLPLDLLDDLTAQRVPAEDQHALADMTKAPDAVTQAQTEQEADEDEEARHERIPVELRLRDEAVDDAQDRKSTRLNSSHLVISYAVFCLKKKNRIITQDQSQCR